MRITELSLRSYRVFEEVDLELPARVIGIFGPNGAGKSTLVESILWCLYGRARTPKDGIRTQGVLTDCEVRVVFEHGGGQYEVRRAIKGKNHQVEAELYGGGLRLAAGVTETDAQIAHLLRMDQQVFRASVFAEQKQLDAFSDVTRAKRKEMVLRLLGIRPVDAARAAARTEARDAKARAEQMAVALPDVNEAEKRAFEMRERVSALEEASRESAAALEEARRRSEVAGEAFEASDTLRERAEKLAVEREHLERRAAEAADHHSRLAERVESLRRDLAGLPAVQEEARGLAGARDRLLAAQRLAEAAARAEALEGRRASLPQVDVSSAAGELEAAEAARLKAQEASTRAEAAAERIRDDLATASATLEAAGTLDPSMRCPTCGQELGEGFDDYVAHCRSEVDRLTEEAEEAAVRGAELRAARADADARARRAADLAQAARTASGDRDRLSEEIAGARARVEELAAPFDGRAPDLEALRADAERADVLASRMAELMAEGRRLDDTEADLAAAAQAVTTTRERLDEVDGQSAGLGFDPEDHRRLRKERDESQRLLETAREEERRASDALAEVRAEVGRLEAEIAKVREIAVQIDEARSRARLIERVSLLLDGFRDHLVSRIGPELSREAEALFRDLTNHEYDDLRIDDETLAIEIADGDRYFPIERYSGSETDLANLALRVAISKHLSAVSGADVGMMVLDEVMAALDAERRDLFVQAMGKLAGHLHQLFVITHAEQVKDQFPASIEVSRTGRRRSRAALV